MEKLVDSEIQNLLQDMPVNLVPETEENREIQINWDYPKKNSIFEELLYNAEPRNRARLLTSSKNES